MCGRTPIVGILGDGGGILGPIGSTCRSTSICGGFGCNEVLIIVASLVLPSGLGMMFLVLPPGLGMMLRVGRVLGSLAIAKLCKIRPGFTEAESLLLKLA